MFDLLQRGVSVTVLLLGAGVALARPVPEPVRQFVLFDVTFTYAKADADNSLPSKSHYYVYGHRLNAKRPRNWTRPVDFRHGTVHVRMEVLERPESDEAVQWSLCYIPHRGIGNGYGCTGTDAYVAKGVHEKDVAMNAFWENEGIVWRKGIKQMDLVMKDKDGQAISARPDPEKFLPTKVRITLIQVAAGTSYDPKLVPSGNQAVGDVRRGQARRMNRAGPGT